MKKNEAYYQTQFGKYVMLTKYEGHFELKYGSERIYFKSILPHQWVGLEIAKHGLYMKHSDADPRQKPLDCSFTKAQGFLVCIYESKKGYCIPFEKIIALESVQKSITEEEANSLADRKIQFV